MSRAIDRFRAGSASVGVVGLGYVGLPVAVTFSEAGLRVTGVDTDPERVAAVEAGRSYLRDIPDERIAPLRTAGSLRATTSYRKVADLDGVLICVPTPLNDGSPDLSAIEDAGRRLAEVLTPGTLVVLESTTYPGTTEEVLLPILEGAGLVAGRDFLLAYSPERIDPGNRHFGLRDIPKVVAGFDEASARAAEALYGRVVTKVVTASSPRNAEMSKLIENVFRHVNIALVNELAVYARDLGVDIWEAIDLAATKPFGYAPFWPSPGWGGHCIPLDPSYLSWRVRQDQAHEIRFVELAHTVRSEMPRYVVERVAELLNEFGKPIRGCRILGIGAAYKAGTEDTRGSPGLDILGRLATRGADVSYHDPLVPEAPVNGGILRSVGLGTQALRDADLVVAFVPQEGVDWDLIAGEAPLVLDCCNALAMGPGNVFRL